ncbi:hypothetical protein BGX33_001622 [Mortierella sp. NVP41]|nr:hypothetical protein BGX33_001622 [Mortierella sp. NVP41]
MAVLATSPTDLHSESVRSLYNQLTVRLRDASHLQGVGGALLWDQEVMMPSKAAPVRAQQMAVLVGLLHDMQISPVLGSLLEELEHRQSYRGLVERVAKASAALNSKAAGAWTAARKDLDFSKFAPFLEEQVKTLRQKVAYRMKGGVCEDARKINEKARVRLGLSEADECYNGYYQALMNTFETGFQEDRLQALLENLKQHLIPLIAKIKAKNFQHDNSFALRDFDIKKQTEFSHNLAKKIGFDTDASRLDVSTHPFTRGAHPSDVRMTTRYTVNNVQEGITGTVHETGHSLYEQGRNKEYADTPVSMALSLGVHESQSLLWLFADHEDLQAVTVDQVYYAFNRVKPGFIRAEADEVTYPMHIIVRYEIEVADVLGLWNAKMKEYLSLEVTEDRLGCLQDIHWSFGTIGYFPTYTLGSIYAVQIFEDAKEVIPDLDEHLAKGEFHVLKEWLSKNVHEQGSLRESGNDLIFDLTGKHVNSSLYVKYLTDKYTEIYDL